MVRQYRQLNGHELEQIPGDSKGQGRLELQRVRPDLVTEQQQQCYTTVGFPRWLSGKESACQCRRCEFDSWVRKIPWRRSGWLATHSSILAREIPWAEEPGRLQSMGLQKSRTQLSDRTTTTNSTEKLRESEILRPRHQLVSSFQGPCEVDLLPPFYR